MRKIQSMYITSTKRKTIRKSDKSNKFKECKGYAIHVLFVLKHFIHIIISVCIDPAPKYWSPGHPEEVPFQRP